LWDRLRDARVIGNFESTPVIARDTVKEVLATIDPHRQLSVCETQITRRSAEEENLLTRRSDNCI